MLKQEWRLAWREGVLPVAALLYVAAGAYALWNGTAWANRERAEVERFRELDRARLNRFRDRAAAMEQQLAAKASGPIPVYEFTWGPRRPAWSPAWAPQSAILPPGRLAALMVGQRDLRPLAYSGYRPLPTVRPAGNPLALLHGSLDLAFVTLYLLPLVILATSFNVLAGDRESGTAGLLFSQPVSMRGILFRRIALRGGLLLAIQTALVTAAPGWSDSGAWLLGMLWIAGSLVYGLFWLVLVFWMNTRGNSSARNAVLLGAAWLLLLVILPAGIFAVADWAYPVPSRIESVRDKRGADVHARNMAEAGLVKDHLARHPEFAGLEYSPEGKRRLAAYARWEAEESLLRDSERRFDAQLQRQQHVADIGSLLSPAALLRSVLVDLSGAGPHRYEHFLNQASRFRKETRGFFWPLIYEDRAFRSADYARVPRFQYEEERALDAAQRVVPRLGFLLALTIVIAAAGYRRSSRAAS
jgi:ABC-2 type transport system permease protein